MRGGTNLSQGGCQEPLGRLLAGMMATKRMQQRRCRCALLTVDLWERVIRSYVVTFLLACN